MESTTSTKAAIRSICDFNDSHGVTYYKTDVFEWAGVSRRTGYRILAEDRSLQPRTFHKIHRETRGRKKKISDASRHQLKRFIESNGHDSRILSWGALPAEAGLELDVSAETVRRSLKQEGFRRCLACQKDYVSPNLAARRQKWAADMLDKYPTPDHWKRVRFSDETHFGWGPEGRSWVLRRPWEKKCQDCVVEKRDAPPKDLKRLHAWAAVGWDFKSPLVWYTVPGNSNGKMSLQVYRDAILEPIVGNWLREGHDFVLEEDNDSGHGTGKNNIVRTWKTQNHLTSYFNCASSPDLPPIEKAWIAPKMAVRGKECWDDNTLRELAEEGWEGLTQAKINAWIEEIPTILYKIKIGEGQATAY